jgi:hypothetical protein
MKQALKKFFKGFLTLFLNVLFGFIITFLSILFLVIFLTLKWLTFLKFFDIIIIES